MAGSYRYPVPNICCLSALYLVSGNPCPACSDRSCGTRSYLLSGKAVGSFLNHPGVSGPVAGIAHSFTDSFPIRDQTGSGKSKPSSVVALKKTPIQGSFG